LFSSLNIIKMIHYGRLQWQKLTHDRPDLSSERAPPKDKIETLKKKSLIKSLKLGSTPRHTDWLTVSRNVTLTLTKMIQSRKIRWVGHLAWMGRRRMRIGYWWGSRRLGG
jgi:hypothetical protein